MILSSLHAILNSAIYREEHNAKKRVITFVLVVGLIIFGTKLFVSGTTNSILEVNNSASIDHIESGYIYFGRPNCPYCEVFYPNLEKSAINNNINIIYLNTDEIVSEEELNSIIEKYNIEYVPYLVKIENGEVHKTFNNTDLRDEEKTLENLKMFFK